MLSERYNGSSESPAHYLRIHLLSVYFLLSARPLLSADFLDVSCYKRVRLTTSAYGSNNILVSYPVKCVQASSYYYYRY